jgi:predicted dehydrogenase
VEFITGSEIESLCADLTSFVAGRRLDDDAAILLRLRGGAKGTLVCSQVATGEENRLSIRLYGSRAGLEWHQQEPNTLIYKVAGRPWERLRTGQGYLGVAARAAARLPPGHPEGYIEAFANLYRSFIEDVRRLQRGEAPLRDYPGAREGVRGVRFVTAAVASSQAGAAWRPL